MNHVIFKDIRKQFIEASYPASNYIQAPVTENLSLLVGKALRPFATVECPWTRSLVADVNPRISFPYRSTFTAGIVPKFGGETKTKYFINQMNYASGLIFCVHLVSTAGRFRTSSLSISVARKYIHWPTTP